MTQSCMNMDYDWALTNAHLVAAASSKDGIYPISISIMATTTLNIDRACVIEVFGLKAKPLHTHVKHRGTRFGRCRLIDDIMLLT